MSNTCNAPGCRNDRRYRERFIVMPHVVELKFHGPRPDEYHRWESKLERAGYQVTAATKICSNHFKHGRPLEASRVPTLHMRKYPDWALTRQEALSAVKDSDDSIISEMVAHMAQYLRPEDSLVILKSHFPAATDVPVSDAAGTLCEQVLSANKDRARSLVGIVATAVLPGKVLEALAMYKHGIEFENVQRFHTPKHHENTESGSHLMMETETSDPSEFEPNLQAAMDFHTYMLKTNDTENTVKGHCTRKACSERRRRLEDLEKQDHELQQRVSVLEKDNDDLRKTNSSISSELTTAKERSNDLQMKVEQPRVTFDKVKHDDNLVVLYTGLTSRLFHWVYKEVQPAAEQMVYWKGGNTSSGNLDNNHDNINPQKRGPSRRLDLENELLLTFMKLKLNVSEAFLAHLFNISFSLLSSILSTWIPLLSKELEGLLYWPTRQEVRLCYPDCFRRWTDVICILDCFEIPAEKPSHVDANTKIFSAYKNRTTVKFLLACTPGGSISFISSAAGGNMSDKELVLSSGILDKFTPGSQCMVDKGFRIEGELLERGVTLIIPPFVKEGKPFTEAQNESGKAIANARIHVERVIGRVRDFSYLDGVIPVTQWDLIGPAVKLCCELTNLKPSVVTLSGR